MKKEIVVVKNGNIEYMDYSKKLENKLKEEYRNKRHMCWDFCDVDTCLSCPKMYDFNTPLKEMTFITEGYQIINSEDECEYFKVTKCKRLAIKKLLK